MGLTACQQNAFDKFVNSDGHMTISGPAGCGKTYLTKELISYYADAGKNVALAAPTHQAKNVLSKMTGEDASTLHSLLRIHPETYEDQRNFTQNGDTELDDVDILLVDEASMIDNDLYDIMGNEIPRKCRILGVGDKYQLQPVRHEPGIISPMFTRFDTAEMTQVMRQAADNPIIQVSTGIRNGDWFKTNWSRENKTGVLHIPQVHKMIDFYLNKLKSADDLMDYRILCYTNECVNTFNSMIRNEVYSTDEPYVVGEYLVLQQPVMKSDGKYKQVVIDNGEIVKIRSIRQFEYETDMPKMDKETFDVAELTVERDNGSVQTFNVLWDEHSIERFKAYVGAAANAYRSYPRGTAKLYWKAFWDLKDTMIDTKSLGAGTVHKSQGSTLKGVCVYTQDFGYADEQLMQQLAYVAVTRPTDWCMFN